MILPAGDLSSRDTDFRTRVTVLGAEPRTEGWPFPAQLTIDLRDLTAGAVAPVPGSVQLEVSPRQMMTVTFAPAPGRDTAVTRVVPVWYLRIAGRLRATAPWTRDQLQHAISRSLAQTLRWSGEVDPFYATRIPRDGGQLLAQFREGCDRLNPLVVMAQGCTEFLDAPVPAPVPAPVGCAVRTTSDFWLRPRATFTRTGPRFRAGTLLQVVRDTGLRQGDLGLYHVEVEQARGFAALSARDLAGCGAFPPPTPCATFTAPRTFDFYARDARGRITRRSLTRGTRLRLRARLTGDVPGIEGTLRPWAVRILSGTASGRDGVAAFALAELHCDVNALPVTALP